MVVPTSAWLQKPAAMLARTVFEFLRNEVLNANDFF
jgi:hypothetical protein